MKTRYFLLTLCAALLTLFAGCSDDNATRGYLPEFQLSSSYIHFEMEGGVINLDLSTIYAWHFKDEDIPSWLTISPHSGVAGDYTLSFTASEVSGSKSAELEISLGEKSQFIYVTIGETVVQEATILDVLNGSDGATYLVSGTCTRIASTSYGNFYMEDEEGNSLYIYGTVDSGGSYNWSSFDIDVGDYVTVQGPRSTYGSTVELVDATFISRTKNLIKVEDEGETIGKEGGETTVRLSVSGSGWNFTIPEDDRDWLSMVGSSGTDTLSVVFYASANEGALRSSDVVFTTERNGETYTATATITQEGGTVEATAAEIAEGADGANYILTGYISRMASTTYGNYDVTDYTGTVYVYGTLDADGNSKNFESLGINDGDIVRVTGPKSTYGETIELVNVTVNEYYSVTDVSVADFIAAEESDEVYYRVTATITEVSSEAYGDIYVNDGNSEEDLYIYGLAPGYGGKGANYSELGLEVGDTITFVATRGSYKDTIEATNAFYVGTVTED